MPFVTCFPDGDASLLEEVGEVNPLAGQSGQGLDQPSGMGFATISLTAIGHCL